MIAQTNVLISESNRLHCDLLRKAFESKRPRLRVVASVCSTTEMLAALGDNRPHVAIISSDLLDGTLTGIRVLPKIRKTYPDTRILVLIGSPTQELVTDAFRFGAHGVFCRNDPFDLMCKSVEVISQGQIWANTKQLHYILDAFGRHSRHVKIDKTVESRLTRREAATVRLAVEGLSNRDIATQLGLTEHTVKNYLFRVFDKLGVSNRVELVLSCLHQEVEWSEEPASGNGSLIAKHMVAGK